MPRGGSVDYQSSAFFNRIAGVLAFLIPCLAVVSVGVKTFPKLEAEFHPFRIRSSPSTQSWRSMQEQLRGQDQPVPLVITGDSIYQLYREVEQVEGRLNRAKQKGEVVRYVLPFGIIPHRAKQQQNRELLRAVVDSGENLVGARIGFN